MQKVMNSDYQHWHSQLHGFAYPAGFLRCLESTTSTMDLARELIEQHVPLPENAIGIALARQQTHGRGRLERNWDSRAGNLLTTVILPLGSNDLSKANGFSLVVGCAIASFLRENGIPVKLKWPNDILDSENRKLGGVLIELLPVIKRHSGTGLPEYAILTGIGLNLISCPEEASSLKKLGIPEDSPLTTSPAAFLAGLLPFLTAAHAQFIREGFPSFKSEWLTYAQMDAKEVQFTHNNEKLVGTFIGLTDHGTLQVLHNHQIKEICAGDVSMIGDRMA
jgi:BirA family biotin operon repressor/biotin-[acetyl-CoA-carboxylase] ligase